MAILGKKSYDRDYETEEIGPSECNLWSSLEDIAYTFLYNDDPDRKQRDLSHRRTKCLPVQYHKNVSKSNGSLSRKHCPVRNYKNRRV